MSRIFEALRQSELEAQQELATPPPETFAAVEKLASLDKFVPPSAPAARDQGLVARSDAPTVPTPVAVTVASTACLEVAEAPAVVGASTPAPASVSDFQFPVSSAKESVPSIPSAGLGQAVDLSVAEGAGPLETGNQKFETDLGTSPTAPAFDLARLASFRPETALAGHLVSLLDERGLGAEKFRVLATRLANLRRTSSLKLVQVTSSIVGEGKTLIACNLAVTLAKRSGQTVLLIEGDLRKPAVCSLLGLSPAPEGLGEWAQKEEGASVVPYLRRVGDTPLCLLPAGSVQHPVALLQSGRLADLVKQLSGWFDWVVVDTPPLLPMADANLWARLVDGTLMVIRAGVVPRRALAAAVESMDGPKLIGVVMNDAKDFSRMDYYDRYYSPDSESKAGTRKSRKAKK